VRNHGRQYAQGEDLYRVKVVTSHGTSYKGPYATVQAAKQQAGSWRNGTNTVTVEFAVPDWQELPE
jgi:hypothetical protein